MGLVKCKECSKEISTNAKTCPSCGAPTKRPESKGKIYFLIILLAGCYLVNKYYTEPAQMQYSETNSGYTETSVIEDKIDLQVTMVKKQNLIDASPIHYPDRGNEYILIDVAIKNKSKMSHYVNSGNFTMVDTEGVAYSYDSATFGQHNPLRSVDLPPNSQTSGRIVFQIKANNNPAKLIYEESLFGSIEKQIAKTEPDLRYGF